MATSQFQAHEYVQQLLELRRESDLVVETPAKIYDDGSIRITFIGTESDFQSLYSEVSGSSEIDAEVVETGSYDPDTPSFLRVLTTQQQEILRAAVAEGYDSKLSMVVSFLSP